MTHSLSSQSFVHVWLRLYNLLNIPPELANVPGGKWQQNPAHLSDFPFSLEFYFLSALGGPYYSHRNDFSILYAFFFFYHFLERDTDLLPVILVVKPVQIF